MRRGLKSVDQKPPAAFASEAEKLFRIDDDNRVASVERHMLRPLVLDAAHKLAKAGLGILQPPPRGGNWPTASGGRGVCRASVDGRLSGHADQISRIDAR